MNDIKKYFKFKGTISGTNYLLRNLLSSVVSFMGGYCIGYGIVSEVTVMVLLGIGLILPAFWFSIATIYKRISALFNENVGVITGLIILAQLIGSGLGRQHPVTVFTNIVLLIFGLFLIFKNSNIENHEG